MQRQPVAFFTRTRTGALVSRLNNDVIGAQRAFSDTLSGVVGNLVTLTPHPGRDARPVLAGHAAGAGAAAGVRDPGAADRAPAGRAAARGGRPQRGDGHPDDRAVLRAGRHPGQAVRPARRGDPRVRRPGRPGARHRGAHRDGAVDLRLGADAGVRAGPGAGLRPRRVLRADRGHGRGRRGDAGPAAHPALRPAHRAGQRPGRRDERAGQLRAGVRGARPAAADRRAGRPVAAARRAALGRVRSGGLRLPGRRRGVAGLAGGGRAAGQPGRRAGAARRLVPGRAGSAGRAGRVVRGGQVHHRAAAPPPLRRRRRGGAARRGRRARPVVRHHPRRRSAWSPRTATCSTSRSGRTCCWPGRRPTRTSCGRRCAGPGSAELVGGAARRPGHRGRRARLPALRRRAAAADHRPAAAGPAAGGGARRGHRAPRLHLRGRGAGGAGRGAGTGAPRW